tara:strand:- start:25085 stop:26359 length:1275 start_codon:yes stop_codon:yes gene_type:complete
MQEDFLHYIWKFQKFTKSYLKTDAGEELHIINQGNHNLNSGPDFFNAQLKIDNQHWAGNVEIHLKSSDWYAHHHEIDDAYDNVILHVVWQHDVEVFRRDNTVIPTLVLNERVDKITLENYKKLQTASKKWIPCEDMFPEIDTFLLQNWLERLYFERLENKSQTIMKLLNASKNDWEAVVFKMLAKSFGLKNNGEAFLSIVNSVDFSVIKKIQNDKLELEALLFGQARLLEGDSENEYFKKLKSSYDYLKNKFSLNNNTVLPVSFFRLRPVNFPTIRLAQLATVYSNNPQLFSKLVAVKSKEDVYTLFDYETSSFWDTHYHFQSTSARRKKKMTKSFVDLIIINTLVPVIFCYSKFLGKDTSETIISLMSSVAKEENAIVNQFTGLSPVAENALLSQGLIELKNNYCDKKKCLECAVGNSILNNN